jgi:leucyl-tRNA synthetase
MHQTIKKVTEDIKEFKYNTAIASIMEYVNLLIEAGLGFSKQSSKPSVQTDIKTRNSIYLRNLALILAPFAPHLAEEVWVNVLEEKFSIHRAVWPKHDPKKTFEETVTIAVQVNGKLRSLMTVTSDQVDDQEFVISLAKKDEKVSKWISGEVIKKEIYVKGKLVNFVV